MATKPPRSKKRLITPLQIVVALVLTIGIGSYAVIRSAPLEWAEIRSQWDLKRAGVVRTLPVQGVGLEHYTRDTCKDAPVGQQADCACVALIHGLGDNALTWKKILLVPPPIWERPVKLVAWNLPGSGKSFPPKDPSGYRARELARALKADLAPQCRSWTVVGNSLGGQIAAWLALDWPEGVNKLMLVDSSGLRASTALHGDSRSDFTSGTVESLKEFQRRAYAKPREIPDHVWFKIATQMAASNSAQVLKAQTSEDLLDGKLQAIRRPTLVFWGRSDRVIEPDVGRAMRSQIPGALWREAPDCGHLPQKECAAELAESLRDLLKLGAV